MNRKPDAGNLLDTIVAQSGGKINRESLGEAVKNKDFSGVLSSLSPQDRAALQAAMSDKEQLRALLSSQKAKELLSKLRGGHKNG